MMKELRHDSSCNFMFAMCKIEIFKSQNALFAILEFEVKDIEPLYHFLQVSKTGLYHGEF